MPIVPDEAERWYSYAYLGYYPEINIRVEDDNPDETGAEADAFPPVCRMGPLLSMMFVNEARTFDASNSFVQYPSFGPVSSYSWSNGGAASASSYTFAATGFQTVTCTVDGTTTGTRFVHVVSRPGSGGGSADAITDFTFTGPSGDLLNGAWGGSSCEIEVTGDVYKDVFKRGMPVCVYIERWQVVGGVRSLHSAGEIFSGVITDPALELRPTTDRGGTRYRFTARTLDALLKDEGQDGDAHIMLDKNHSDQLGGGNNDIINEYPFHVYTEMSAFKAAYHLLRWHVLVQRAGATYSIAEITDLIVPWWEINTADWQVPGFNIDRGNIADTITSLVTEGLFHIVSTRLSAIIIALPHAMKSTPDALVGTIDVNRVYAFDPIEGGPQKVRQSKVAQAASARPDQTTAIFIASYPAVEASVGSLDNVRHGYFLQTLNAAVAVAKGRYRLRNERKGFVAQMPGAHWDLTNPGDLINYSAYTGISFSGTYYCISYSYTRDHANVGDIIQRAVFREVGSG